MATAKPEQVVSFKAVKVTELPPAPARGGKASLKPAMQAFLSGLPDFGTYEMASSDADKGHPTNRVAQLREVAGDDYTIDTRTLESGKRYRIFATRLTDEQKAERAAKLAAEQAAS